VNTPMPINSMKTSDFSMSPEVFGVISGLIRSEAGISIAESKVAMVKSRLSGRLRRLKLSSFDEYVALVQSHEGADERERFISALTTNVSHFFREPHHFETLRKTIAPVLLEKSKAGGRVRIWSSACSNGQEPYSIAMALLDSTPEIANYDVKILATDIDPVVLKVAKQGIYEGPMLSGLDDATRDKYFHMTSTIGEKAFQASEQLRAMITFRRLNLVSEWPMSGVFDIIFCRNVLIYFDEDTQQKVCRNFHRFLGPQGWLFLGHSERIPDEIANDFESLGVTTYNKKTLVSPVAQSGAIQHGGGI